MRVGLVGCGRMGKKHLRVMLERPDVSLVSLCDRSAERLAAAADGVVSAKARFEDAAQMYRDVPLDLVVVATPPGTHAALVIPALTAGVAVLCEKPLATDLVAADRMVDAASSSGSDLSVHHQYATSEALARCRALVESGAIGDVVLIRGRGKGGRRAGVELVELGTHLTLAMIALVGRPSWCSAHIMEGDRLARASDVRPCTQVAPKEADMGPVLGTRMVATFGLGGGVIGELQFLGHAEAMPAHYGIDVLGTKGQLALRFSRFVTQPLWHLPRPMQGLPDAAGDWRPIDLPEGANRGRVEGHYDALIEALRSGGAVPCPGGDAREALEMVLAAARSHRESGRRITWPLVDREQPFALWEANEGPT